MYGCIIGDIVGSKYEFSNIKTKAFPLFSPGCSYTDDSLMTIAVAKALVRAQDTEMPFRPILVEEMQRMGRKYPYPQGGYGGRFSGWLRSSDPQPYFSFGNGSAMRVSPCGVFAVTLEEASALAKASAEVTHNHPEGIKGAQAVAAAIFMARSGNTKEDIRRYISENFYPLNRNLDEIRRDYGFDESCQGTVPESIIAFLESNSFEDAIRNAISIGGDSDTVGAITGSIAWSYYCGNQPSGENQQIWQDAAAYLPQDLREFTEEFSRLCSRRMAACDRTILL